HKTGIWSVRTLAPLLRMEPAIADAVTSFTIRNVDVESLDILKRCPHLRSLTIDEVGSLSNLDTASLQDLRALEHLTLGGILYDKPKIIWTLGGIWPTRSRETIRDLNFLRKLKG